MRVRLKKKEITSEYILWNGTDEAYRDIVETAKITDPSVSIHRYEGCHSLSIKDGFYITSVNHGSVFVFSSNGKISSISPESLRYYYEITPIED